jgi:glucose/arabinose dehydrogenase
VALLALLALALPVACTHGPDQAAPPTWAPQNEAPPPTVVPYVPGELSDPGPGGGQLGTDDPGRSSTADPADPEPPATSQPSGSGPSGDRPTRPEPPSRSGSSPSSNDEDNDPNVVADHLSIPWGITLLPDGSALVGERSTGRIVDVQPTKAPVSEVMTISGLDTSGDGGLLGLAVSPSYSEDGLVFAYITTRSDNRVVKFTLGGTPQPVLTGIPKGSVDNGGRIGFGPDGDLYVGTGDAGNPNAAVDPASLAGKILRIDVFGQPAEGNPDPQSAVYASGFQDVTGLCWDSRKHLYATDLSSSGAGELNLVTAGRDYGWPSDARGSVDPIVSWPAGKAGPGGCAAMGYGVFVGMLSGQTVAAISMGLEGKPNGDQQGMLTNQYGRLRSVLAAPDGALWITTSNKDGRGTPAPTDDRVLRITPASGTTDSPL